MELHLDAKCGWERRDLNNVSGTMPSARSCCCGTPRSPIPRAMSSCSQATGPTRLRVCPRVIRAAHKNRHPVRARAGWRRRDLVALELGVDSRRGEAYKGCISGTPLFLPKQGVTMDATRPSKLPPSDWVTRCIQQIRLIDPGLTADEAADVARQLHSFERTGAMPPEEAVKFVVAELARATPRFERRSPSRLSTTIRL